MIRDPAPAHPEAKSILIKGKLPACGKCLRRIQAEDQWRCPYVECRAWLRGTES